MTSSIRNLTPALGATRRCILARPTTGVTHMMSHGRGGGHRHYWSVGTTAAGNPKIDHVRLWLTGEPDYPSTAPVVHLYNRLKGGARKTLREIDQPQLAAGQAVVDSGLVGPFQVRNPLLLNATDGAVLVGADGIRIDGEIQPDVDFYLRPAPGTSGTTLTATAPHRLNGRVLTGVAAEGAVRRFTPVALATPTDVEIHFEIRWDGDCEHC